MKCFYIFLTFISTIQAYADSDISSLLSGTYSEVESFGPRLVSASDVNTAGNDATTGSCFVPDILFAVPCQTIVASIETTNPISNGVVGIITQPGNVVFFTGSATFSSSNSGVAYSWNYGDGSAVESGHSVSHVFPNPGTYIVKFKATDSLPLGGSSTDSITVRVLDNNVCAGSLPICSGINNVPAPTGAGSAETGIDYDCLGSQPRPRWYFFKTGDTAGNLNFTLTQFTGQNQSGIGIDVDFIVWGPFSEPVCGASNLNVSTQVDCSYSPDSVELINIVGAPANSFYVLLITNFDGRAGFINLDLDAASTSDTNCDIICQVEVVAVSDYTECEVDTDGFAQFDLRGKDAEVLNGQDPSLYSVTYYDTVAGAENLTGALNSPYTNTANPQQIFVAITDNERGCSVSTVSFFLEVDNGARANSDQNPIEQVSCDYLGENDGLVQFDLTLNSAEVLDGQDAVNYIITYYATQADSELGTDPIPNIYENTTNPQTIYVRVDNDTPDAAGMDSSICYAVAQLTLRADLRPLFDLEDSYILCVDTNGMELIPPPVLETGLSSSVHTFEWALDGTVLPGVTGASLAALQSGTYTVTVTNIATGCVETDSAEVVTSSAPSVSVEVETQAFSENSIIVAEATGEGDYEYSLDDGPWQDNGRFEDVSFGDHTVTARDINGCGTASGSVTVLDYPRFFTPNGDGRNDTWNIVGFAGQSSAKIYIFDRFGKLLKQISPSGRGWNGTFNGEKMPSSDYWFSVEYSEPSTGTPKQFRAHFTLKR